MTFHIHTYGCQMNVRESDAAAAILEAAGHVRAADEFSAEILLVNSCTVRDMAERKALGKTCYLIAMRDGRWRHPDAAASPLKVVGMIGCAVQRLGKDLFPKAPGIDFAVGPRKLGMLPTLIERALAGERGILELSGPDDLPSGIEMHSEVAHKAFVSILLGCDNRCSYCIVPDVRGHEWSRPAREVIAEVRALVDRGVKEVCLLGQSVLRYGIRNKAWTASDAPSPGGFTEPFPRLLEALAAIPGLRRIRFTSAHPSGCTDELVRCYREFPQVCRHLHLPVQSGSDRILADMGRRYTRAKYLAAVEKLRALDPEFAITTDVIVGYPGETQRDFNATRSLMERADFDNAFIFKYSPRPGTRSAALPDDVPTHVKEERNQILLREQNERSLRHNSRLVNSVREVLADGPSPRKCVSKGERWMGRDGSNRIVFFTPWEGMKPGDVVNVKIHTATPQTLSTNVLPLREKPKPRKKRVKCTKSAKSAKRTKCAKRAKRTKRAAPARD